MFSNVYDFRQMHRAMIPLRLPNAWDAGSARLFESKGAQAIATSSAAVAWALGFQDGRRTPFEEIAAVAGRMTRVLTVPLSFDIENGYSDIPKTVAENVMRLVDLGVAGVNIEDGVDEPYLLGEKIEAIRNVIARYGGDLFVNVRTDTFIGNLVDSARLIQETTARGQFYAGVGADGFFVPGLVQPAHIQAIAQSVPIPLNVMAWPGLPDAVRLAALGVKRLSTGSGISQAILGKAESLVNGFLDRGQSWPLFENAASYSQLQDIFETRQSAFLASRQR